MVRRLVVLVVACLVLGQSVAVSSQVASPVADVEPIESLFVQTSDASTLTPLDAPDGEATHELVLHDHSAQTVYFADRPSRQVGTIGTADVVANFASEPENPPNAALVAQTEAGGEEILVLVLHSGVEDTAAGTITYQVSLLSDFDDFGYELQGEPVTDVTEARSYGTSSLFIDDLCLYPAIPPFIADCSLAPGGGIPIPTPTPTPS